MDVGGWLRSLGLGQYEALFRASDIDADILPELTEIDFEKLGVSLGHRKRLLRAISGLTAADTLAVPSASTAATPHDAAERRQLTVMFCDLVGSTPCRRGSTPRNCARRSAPIRTPFPPSSRAMTALSPNTWATGCWSISGIRGRMRTTPSGRCGPGWR